jgi:superfamily II DNA or RNA helicase
MANIYDNIDQKFTEGLSGIVGNSGVERVDFCAGYFNLRGWDLIMNQIDTLPGGRVEELDETGREVKVHRVCRLLIGMHRPDEEIIRAMYSGQTWLTDRDFVARCKRKIARDFRNQLLWGVPSNKDQETLNTLLRQLQQKKVVVKLHAKREPLHAKLYIAYRPTDFSNKIQALMGSSNLTYSGLTGQGELNGLYVAKEETESLAAWFDARWNDRFCIDISEALIDILQESWACANIPPYYIYLKAAYHLSQEARAGLNEFTLSKEFMDELFPFQQNAVKIAARYLNNEKRGGAMIGDVVGLGKTITACAISKIYEEAFGGTTLVICPANLQDMWRSYIKKYDLKAYVKSNAEKIDIENERYYRLIIIDESHNLRNANGVRYRTIKSLIEKQDSRVLLLTATPYNKDYEDIANQLALFLSPDQDLGIRPENHINEIGGEYKFAYELDGKNPRSLDAFRKSRNADDWNELMKLFLVRRTRSFVKENYAETDPTNGRKYLQFADGRRSYFPDRIPKAIKFQTAPGDQYSRLYSDEMLNLMGNLSLPRYGLMQYYDTKHDAELNVREKEIIENLSRAGQRQMGFCKSTFFKRIDSCGYSFLLTLYRHILRNALFIYAIENKLELPIGDETEVPDFLTEDQDPNLIDSGGEGILDPTSTDGSLLDIPMEMEVYMKQARAYYSSIRTKNRCAWISSGYFKRTLKLRLKQDCEILIGMLKLCGKWVAADDQKLNELERLINRTHAGEKVVIFTQYSDTADYLYGQLRRRGFTHIDVATGGTGNTTDIVERFSPVSNKAQVAESDQTRVLIATDVLSEGQNLQDAHIVVNFDLPWAIIRLIQRAGRVDRIGQVAPEIYCYSFFPAEGVEKIIRLRKRLNDRINENAQIIGSDEIFFEGNEQNLRDMFNERSGSLDDEDDSDVDLASQAYQIWKNAIDANPALKGIIENLPNVIYSTKASDSPADAGVITYVRTAADFDILKWVAPDGRVISQSQKKILQALACTEDTPCEPQREDHHALVARTVEEISQESTNVGGNLGRRFSTRYRIHNLLDRFYNDREQVGLFFTYEQRDELKLAIDEIFRYPLVESTRIALTRMLADRKRSDEQVVDTVLEFRRAGNLCNIPDEDEIENSTPSIICSMGIVTK